MPFIDKLAYAVHHKPGLIHFIESCVDTNWLSITIIGPQLFPQALCIIGDHRVCAFQYIAAGTVVLLQAHQLAIGIVTLKILDILYLRTAPAVNGLIIITHHKQIVPLPGQQPQPGILDRVGILEFVHQDMGKALLIVLQNVRAITPQLVRTKQQLGKVNRTGPLTRRLIGLVYPDHLLLKRISTMVQVLWPAALVFLCVDKPLGLAGWPLGFIQVELAYYALDQALLVIRIQYLESPGKIRLFPVRAQQSMREAVKSAHPHAANRLPQ